MPHFMSKPWNHWFYFRKAHTFDGHQLTFAPAKYQPSGSKLAPSATTVTASSSSVANRGAHKTVAGLVFAAQNGQDCNLTLSIHLHGEFIAYVVMSTCSR